MEILDDFIVYGLVALLLAEQGEQIGFVSFLFVRGAEMKPRNAPQRRRQTFSTSFADLVPSLLHVEVPFLKHFQPFLFSSLIHLRIGSG